MKPGDLVRLRSGSAPMTVEKVTKDKVQVTYWHKSGEILSQEVSSAVLVMHALSGEIVELGADLADCGPARNTKREVPIVTFDGNDRRKEPCPGSEQPLHAHFTGVIDVDGERIIDYTCLECGGDYPLGNAPKHLRFVPNKGDFTFVQGKVLEGIEPSIPLFTGTFVGPPSHPTSLGDVVWTGTTGPVKP